MLSIAEDIPLACPSVTTLYIRNRCYWVLNKTLIFEDSHAVCRQNGGGLAEIPDRSVEDLVIKKFG